MYFLEQIRGQVQGVIALHAGPEYASEQIPTPSVEKTDPVTPEETLAHAESTVNTLDDQVRKQEELGLTTSDTSLSFGKTVESGNLDTSFNSNTRDLELGAPAHLGQDIDSSMDYSLGERISSPEEQQFLGELAKGDIGFDDPRVTDLAAELGMEEVLRTAGIDGLEPGEVPEDITESTPEMLEGSRVEVQTELDTINSQISSLPEGSGERQSLERRAGLLGGFINAIESALNGELGGLEGGSGGFSGVDVVGDKNVIARGMSHRGIHENTGQADKFLMGMARSARETPWCAGFVSYVCKEAGYNITPTLSSKAFIGETGKGHVAFYAGNNQMLGGNQSDKVSVAPIRKPIQGWTMPEDLAAGKPPIKGGTPPVGAIIVFNRGGSDRNMA